MRLKVIRFFLKILKYLSIPKTGKRYLIKRLSKNFHFFNKDNFKFSDELKKSIYNALQEDNVIQNKLRPSFLFLAIIKNKNTLAHQLFKKLCYKSSYQEVYKILEHRIIQSTLSDRDHFLTYIAMTTNYRSSPTLAIVRNSNFLNYLAKKKEKAEISTSALVLLYDYAVYYREYLNIFHFFSYHRPILGRRIPLRLRVQEYQEKEAALDFLTTKSFFYLCLTSEFLVENLTQAMVEGEFITRMNERS